jgi:hypothetical protein
VIDGADGPVALLDLMQRPRHLDLLHLYAPDSGHARVLQEFAEQAARALRARENPPRAGRDVRVSRRVPSATATE